MKVLSSSGPTKRSKGGEKENTVLFVCVENAGRSQMAEGFFRKYAPRGYFTVSAGTRPSGELNPLAVQQPMPLSSNTARRREAAVGF
jgi:arsenate reductase (thioredoxin)